MSEASVLQSELELLFTNDYVSLALVTAVVYDYILTFPREIEYVWFRSWTWISTMFILVRYLGLYSVMTTSLGGTTFLSGSSKFYRCAAIAVSAGWVFQAFISAAGLVMITRVYAMWNQSKSILWILLLVYVPQPIFGLILQGIYDIPGKDFSVVVVPVANVSFCAQVLQNNTQPLLDLYTAIPRIVLGAMLLFLAVFQTVKQSVEMYKATKQWQPNQYMQQLVRDGIFYFLLTILFDIFYATSIGSSSEANTTATLFFQVLSLIPIYPIMPRFIISVRELYDQDLRRRWQGVDTGFGIISQPIASQNAVVSAIAFADTTGEQDEDHIQQGGTKEPEAIQLELRGDSAHQV